MCILQSSNNEDAPATFDLVDKGPESISHKGSCPFSKNLWSQNCSRDIDEPPENRGLDAVDTVPLNDEEQCNNRHFITVLKVAPCLRSGVYSF